MTPSRSSKKQISSQDLKILGIQEESFRQLSPKEQKQFIRLHALEDSILMKNRKYRTRPDPTKTYKTNFRNILAYLWVPYKGQFITTLFLSVIQSLLTLSLPLTVQIALGHLLEPGYWRDIMRQVILDLTLLLVLMVALGFLMYLRIYMNNLIGSNIIKDLRDDMFGKMQQASFTFLDNNPTGDLISRSTSDINLLKNLLASQLALFIRQSLTIIFSIGAMFVINTKIASVAVLPIPIIFVIMLYYRSKIRPTFKASRETYGDLTSVAQQNVAGMRVVRAFAQESREIRKFDMENLKYYHQNQKLILFTSSFEPIVRIFANVSVILVIIVGMDNASVPDLFALIILVNFSIEPLFFISRFLGDMSKVDATCDRVVEIIRNKSKEPQQSYKISEEYYKDKQTSLPTVRYDKLVAEIKNQFAKSDYIYLIVVDKKRKVLGYISEDSATENNFGDSVYDHMVKFEHDDFVFQGNSADYVVNLFKHSLTPLLPIVNRKYKMQNVIFKEDLLPGYLPDIPPLQGEVEFKNVYLSYGQNDHYELKNITFKTQPGEQIAILGATGSGKSTLIRAIMRFYQISKGTISIDGRDTSNYNLNSLRKQIGIVPQETFLFGRSILENLTLGRPDTPLEEVIRATKLSNIHNYIASLPDKYDTVVGERGVTLSGGQKQRVAIARALIIRPRILILDDATSAVDVDTEYEIQQSFKEMFKGATIFIITQRLSTVRNADRIMVLNHGRIAEFAPHAELLADENGIYSKLYKTLKVEERANAKK